MFPVRDHKPVTTVTYGIYTIIVVCVSMFLYQLMQPSFDSFAYILGVVPRLFDPSLGKEWLYVASSLVMHASFLHILGNLWFLYIFGRQVETCYGHLLTVLFFCIAGVCTLLIEIYLNKDSGLAVFGSSGAISGIIGAYAALGILRPVEAIWIGKGGVRTISFPSIVFILLWFVLQALNGITFIETINFDINRSAVSYAIDLGGFFIGLFLGLLLKPVVHYLRRVVADLPVS